MEYVGIHNSKEFICKICYKQYSSRQNLWKHVNIKHPRITTISTQNNTKTPQNITNNSTIIIGSPQNTTKLTQNIIIKNQCNYCSKILSRYDSLKRHEQKCKNNSSNKIQDENNELKTIIKQQSEELKQMKTILNELINKNCKVHPKTLQKINKQLNGDNNIINENNGTINNTFIIGLGHENLPEIFSKKEKINVLKNRFNSLPFLVEYTHFNNKYPQFKNILITNTQNNLAYKYDNKKKQFIAVDKNELLEDIVDERMCDINSFYEELETDLDDKTREILEKAKDKIDNDPEFRELKKKDIKLIIYNNRSKVSKANINDIGIEL